MRRVSGRVRPGIHCHPDVSIFERGSIIHAVARHAHAVPKLLGRLLGRSMICQNTLYLCDSQRAHTCTKASFCSGVVRARTISEWERSHSQASGANLARSGPVATTAALSGEAVIGPGGSAATLSATLPEVAAFNGLRGAPWRAWRAVRAFVGASCEGAGKGPQKSRSG